MNNVLSKILILAGLACVVPAYAFLSLPRETLVLAEEDQCPQYYGAYMLDEVTPLAGPVHSVACLYR